MSANDGHELHPALKELLAQTPGLQRTDGGFSAYGDIDWDRPIDYGRNLDARMLPALWGNARMLCGLAMSDFKGLERVEILFNPHSSCSQGCSQGAGDR